MDLKLIDTNTSEVDKEEKQQTEEETWGYTTRQHKTNNKYPWEEKTQQNNGIPKLPMLDENKHI